MLFSFLLTHPVWDVTILHLMMLFLLTFLLTHPVWDVTEIQLHYTERKRISTHTSRVGCDRGSIRGLDSRKEFLLTHPVWDVTACTQFAHTYRLISTHTSRVGCDFLYQLMWNDGSISTHTSRVGCDALTAQLFLPVWDFYSHIPCGM